LTDVDHCFTLRKPCVASLRADRHQIGTTDRHHRNPHKVRHRYGLGPEERIYFLAVLRGDASEFEDTLRVTGHQLGRHSVLKARSPVVPNAIAALLIELEKTTRRIPHAYFKWTEGNPIGNLLRFLVLGEGDVAPIAHEVLRRAVPDPKHRPVIHVS
jgi:hypothetical protein